MRILHNIGKRLARFLAKPRPSRHPRAHEPARGDRGHACARATVLLVDGTSRFSSAIKYLTQSTWSHAALYIGDTSARRRRGRRRRCCATSDVEQGVRMIR
jgi:hypothetical protein